MTRVSVKATYNKIASKYLEQRDQFSTLKYLEKLNDYLKPNSKILDLGCGAGKPIDEFFLEQGHLVVGIDISEEQIKLAKELNPKGDYKVEDIADLKPKEYQVDAVLSFYAIFHVNREKHQAIFEKINTFLPSGGYLLVSMGKNDWEGTEDFFGEKMYWSHFDSNKNAEIVKKAGFEILLDEIDESGGEQHQITLAKKVRAQTANMDKSAPAPHCF